MLRLIFGWCLLIASTWLHASLNDYIVKQWDSQDGLASQSLQSIAQDKQGYLWLGTQFGLSRFDGKNFKNFNTNNSPFLENNSINKLHVDTQGFLWIGTKKGLVKFDPQTHNYDKYNVKGPVRDIVEDGDGRIWVAANGLYLYTNNKFRSLNQVLAGDNQINENSFQQKSRSFKSGLAKLVGQVKKMTLAPDGLWLINERYLLKLTNSSTDPARRLKLEVSQQISLPQRLGQSFLYDMAWLEGNLYLASETGAYFLDVDDELRPLSIPYANNATVYKFMSDSNGALWISINGRLLYRDSGGEWQWIEPSESDQAIWFSDIFRDRDDNIWLASFSEGLWQAKPSIVTRHNKLTGLDETIMAIEKSPSGVVWVASKSGIGYLDLDDQYVSQIAMSDINRTTINDLHFQGNRLYIATNRGVLYYQNGTVFTVNEPLLRYSAVFSINPALQGGLWLGTDRGLYRLAFNGLRPFTYNSFLDSKYITHLNEGRFSGWLGTSRGAYYFNERGIQIVGASTALESAHISYILDVPEVATFIATLNDGLFYRAKNKKWQQLDISNGLPYGQILSLSYETNDQHLWVSTIKGVYRLPVSQFVEQNLNLQVEQVITSYSRQLDGQSGQCCTGFSHGSVAQTEESIWYPSKLGVVEVPKSINLFAKQSLVPIIEGVQTDDAFFAADTSFSLELDNSHRNIQIDYTVIDFDASSDMNFRYRLLGLDNTWREAQSRREAIYTNLPPGTFTFQVAAKQIAGNWQDAEQVEYSFTIPKRFDETVYFRLLLVTSIAIGLYFLFLIYRNQERRKQIELERLVESRTIELIEANEKLNQVNDQLKEVSHSDELTGLRSRRFVFDQLPKDIEHFQSNRETLEEQGKALSLVIVNLDDFGRVNDLYGPFAGDSCLQQLAALLNDQIQGSDYVVRWSGDEFLILLRDIKKEQVHQFSCDVAKKINQFVIQLPDGRTTQITCSIGWAFYPLPLLGGQIIGWETSVKIADLALHQVKDNGKVGVAYYSFDESLDAFEFEDNEMLEERIANLIDTGQVTLTLTHFD